jgi:DNA-directed RNA polymerase specialized sigma24 family protein
MSVKKETVGTRLFYARKRIQACLSALLARERGLQEVTR